MEATRVGSIEICVVVSPVTQQLVPEHGIFGLPFVWTRDAPFNKFLESPIALELGKNMEAHGLRVLTPQSTRCHSQRSLVLNFA